MQQLTSLTLRSNFLTFVDDDVFSSLANLVKLDLSKNKIRTIGPSMFQRLGKLKTLVIAHNRVKEIDEDAFADLVDLESIDLQKNAIEFLHPKLFNSQTKLKKLDLGNNYLRVIFSDTFSPNLSSLEYLRLCGNKIPQEAIKQTKDQLNIKVVESC